MKLIKLAKEGTYGVPPDQIVGIPLDVGKEVIFAGTPEQVEDPKKLSPVQDPNE
jgi:hypothetical protein